MKTDFRVFLGACLLLTSAAVVAGSAADPAVGTWELNVAKSKFTGPAPKSETRTYSESADGSVTLIEKPVSADGKESTVSMTYKRDGKDYPVEGSTTIDSISVKRISSRTLGFSGKKAGKVVMRGHRTVSKDGKTLTLTEAGTDENGAKFRETLVFDKR
jgi:hypothetical protein